MTQYLRKLLAQCLAYKKVKESASESEVAHSCPTLCDPVDCSLPGSSVHRILQARILEWVAISFSRRASWPRDWILVSAMWADALPFEPPRKPYKGNFINMGFAVVSDSKESSCNAGDSGSIPGLGRSPWEGNGYPLQYSCLEESTDREVHWATVHGVAELDMTKWLTLSLFFFINMYRMNDSHFSLAAILSLSSWSFLQKPAWGRKEWDILVSTENSAFK